MENAGGEELKLKKALVDRLEKDINKTSTEINKRQIQISTSGKTIDKLKKQSKTVPRTKCNLLKSQDKKTKKDDFKNVEFLASVIQEKFTELQEALAESTVELEVAKKAHMEHQKITNELRTMENTKRGDWLGSFASDSKTEPSGDISLACAKQSVKVLEAQLKEMQPSLDLIAKYRHMTAMYDKRIQELNEVSQVVDEIKKGHDELGKKRFVLLCSIHSQYSWLLSSSASVVL